MIDVILSHEDKRPTDSEVLNEVYKTVDDFNKLVKDMDRKLDMLVSKVERTTE